MLQPQSLQELSTQLRDDNRVEEFSILLHSLTLRLRQDTFWGTVQVRTYFTSGTLTQPYSYEISHLVKTPAQADPYRPGQTQAKSEKAVIALALANTLRFIQEAIQAGHTPEAGWLVANPDF